MAEFGQGNYTNFMLVVNGYNSTIVGLMVQKVTSKLRFGVTLFGKLAEKYVCQNKRQIYGHISS